MKNILFMALSTFFATGCATTTFNENSSPGKCFLENDEPVDCFIRPAVGTLTDEAGFKNAFEHEPWYIETPEGDKRPNIGIASGGGGTKASALSMGVLKRLVDDENIKKVDIISSVSGGGHPVSYLYSRARYAQLMTVKDCPRADEAERQRLSAPQVLKRSLADERDFYELQCMYQHYSQIQFHFPIDDQNYLGMKKDSQILVIPTNDLIAIGASDDVTVTPYMRQFLKDGGYTRAQMCSAKEPRGKCIDGPNFNQKVSAIQSWKITPNWYFDGKQEHVFKCFINKVDKKNDQKALHEIKGIDEQSAHRSFTWHRCWQDIVSSYSSETKYVNSSAWLNRSGAILGGIGLTSLSLPPHHITNSVFDWQVDLSPLYYLQKNGNERLGLDLPHFRTEKWAYSDNTTEMREAAECEFFKDKDIKTSPLNFSDLKCAEKLGLPMWVINATTPTRKVLDFRRTDLTKMDEFRFEFTPHGFGSRQYGYLKNNIEHIDIYEKQNLSLPKALSSSYAFLDPRQRVVPGNGGGVGNAIGYAGLQTGIHALNLDWSISIPNYNMKKGARTAYQFLPFPLHLYSRFDEQKYRAHIPLADGGINRDGLGLLPLLERRTKNIVILNQGASISDLCQFNGFLQGKGLEFVFKGHPRTVGSVKEPNNKEQRLKEGDGGLCTKGFWDENVDETGNNILDPQKWTLPVWKGEIRSLHTNEISVNSEQPTTMTLCESDTPQSPFPCTRIYYITANIYKDDKTNSNEACMAKIVNAENRGDLSEALLASRRVRDITKEHHTHHYPPSLCGWMHRNLSAGTDFPAHNMAVMTLDSSQNTSNAYMDLGWFLAGGLDELFSNEDEQKPLISSDLNLPHRR